MTLIATDVEILWAARFDYRAGWALTLHAHEFFQIIHVLDGAGAWRIDREAPAIAPGQTAVLAPGRLHGLEATSKVRTLDIKFRIRRAALRKACLDAPALQRRPGAAERLERIRCAGASREPHFRERCRLLLGLLLLDCLEGAADPATKSDKTTGDARNAVSPPETIPETIPSSDPGREAAGGGGASPASPAKDATDPALAALTEYLRANLAKRLHTETIARGVGYSFRHLHGRCKQAFGLSPFQYLAQLRIQAACELIRYSDYELKQIAELVGFQTVHHFTRTFRKAMGEPPGAWRDRERAGIGKGVVFAPGFHNHLRLRE